MNVFKKLLPLLLIVAMMFSMTAMAHADGPDGTITVQNLSSDDIGRTYEIYRIFDLTNAASGSGVTYSIKSDWTDFFFGLDSGDGDGHGSGLAFLTTTPPAGTNLPQIQYNNTTYYVNVTSANIEAFANAALTYADANPLVATVASHEITAADVQEGSYTFADLPYGYYLVVPVGGVGDGDHGSICSLTNVNKDATVQRKAEFPSSDKEADEQDVEVGQKVTWTITSEVPDTASYSEYWYEFKDTMSAGLTFGNTLAATELTVKIGSNTVILDSSTQLTLENNPQSDLYGYYTANGGKIGLKWTNNGFEMLINVAEYQDYEGEEITISYASIVNDNAVCNYTHNHMEFNYGNDPEFLEDGTRKDVPVYSSKIVVIKYDSDAPITSADPETGETETSYARLSGVKFVLYKTVEEEYEENGETLTRTVKYYYQYTPASGNTPAEVSWVREAADGSIPAGATEVTTDLDGLAEFPGLTSGTYYLHETEGLPGYNLLTSDITVTVNAPTNGGTEANPEPIGVSVETMVANSSGSTLPETGGIGTTIFYIAGAILLVVAGVLLFVRRRVGYEK